MNTKLAEKRLGVPLNYETFALTLKKQEEPEFKSKLWQRMWKMEGIFAEAKNFHGLRRARYRGQSKVQIQVYLISTVQNLKRLAGAFLDLINTFFKTDGGNHFKNLVWV